jgi:hypothetical protein
MKATDYLKEARELITVAEAMPAGGERDEKIKTAEELRDVPIRKAGVPPAFGD